MYENICKTKHETGRFIAFIQHYKSIISGNVFNFISKELDINGNICETLDKYFEILNKYEKLYTIDFDSKYDDYRDFNQTEKIDFITNKVDVLAINEQLLN